MLWCTLSPKKGMVRPRISEKRVQKARASRAINGTWAT